jgi:predicted ATPase
MENDPSPRKPAVVIRTPDHHLRVFVSSTLSELAEERKAVRQSINRLRLTPIMFESGARAHPAQDVYQAYLSQSHIFIGIYWQSYGWKKPGDQLSGLEDEYNRSSGLPRLIYIKDPAPNRDPALKRMLEHIREENGSSYKHFTTTTDLRELIENDLMLLLTEYFETASAERRSSADLTATTLTNVPIPRNPLIGRELELENACQLILRDDVALLTLTGPAGTGKSRLGIQIALDLRSQFKDGVYMVGLEYIRDPGLVIPSIAKTLSITETDSGLSMLELLKQSLCKKQILLLLDNFEQVLKAAPQVGDLLEACPKVKALVTSRAPLHIRAEKELPIPPLAVPPLKESKELQPLSQYSAVQLFIQRCQAVKVDFQVSNENAPAVAEICSRLDGLPLAIELAAARIKLLPPQALLSRLERRFEVLRGGTKDLPERQKTMYSAIDWSYELLNECEKQLFRRLSVFCGGCTIEAVLAVCNIENCGQIEIVDCLQSLVDNNLIRLFEEAPDEPRLSMLESIREFAYEHLVECEEAKSIDERYEQFYMGLSEQAESELQNPTQQSWCKRVEAELDNFRAVMSSAIERRKNEIALKIALSLWRFWWVQGYWSEGLHWMLAWMARKQSHRP